MSPSNNAKAGLSEQDIRDIRWMYDTLRRLVGQGGGAPPQPPSGVSVLNAIATTDVAADGFGDAQYADFDWEPITDMGTIRVHNADTDVIIPSGRRLFIVEGGPIDPADDTPSLRIINALPCIPDAEE